MVHPLHLPIPMHGGPGTTRREVPMQSRRPQTEVQSAASSPRQPTVLIVEDENVSRNALRKLLAAQGYEACAYECAEDALAAMADRTMPPVALIDVDLPG